MMDKIQLMGDELLYSLFLKVKALKIGSSIQKPLPTNACKVLHGCYSASVKNYYDHIFSGSNCEIPKGVLSKH